MCCGVSIVRRLASVCVATAVVACVLLQLLVASAEAVVDLEDFRVADRQDGILVTWVTGNELTTYGFNLYRATVSDFAQSVRLNKDMIAAKQFPTVGGAEYEYLDTDVKTGITYYYWLEILDLDKRGMRGREWSDAYRDDPFGRG